MITRGIVLQPENSIDVEPGAVTLIDQSRYRSDGTITGANYVRLPSGAWVLDYDPTIPSYVEIAAADCPQLNFTNEDFSLVARVYLNNLTAAKYLFTRGLVSADGYQCYITNLGRFDVLTSQAAAVQASRSANGAMAALAWYTVGFSRIGANILLYIQGLVNTPTVGVHINPLTCARSAKIGIQDNLLGDPFDGKIGFLAVYNYALTAGQHLIEHEKVKHWIGIGD